MAVFEIETPSGKVLEIEAPDQATALRGAQEWSAQNVSFGQLKEAVTDVPKEIGAAFNAAVKSGNAGLNPFSDERRASIEQEAKAPFWDFSGQFERLKNTGAALLSPLAAASSPLTGAARSLIGHPYSALSGAPYSEAKGDVDTAMMALAPRGVSPRGPRLEPARVPTPEEIRATANQQYADMRNLGAEINPQPVSQVATQIEQNLNARGLTPRNVPETYGVIRDLQNPPAGSRIRAIDIENARQELVQARQNPTNRREAVAANEAIDQIDNYLANIPPGDVLTGDAARFANLAREARANYGAASRADMVEGKLELGDLNAATAHAGQNVDNATRQAIKQLIRPDKNGVTPAEKAGFTAEEIAELNRVARGGPIGNVLRFIGKLAPTNVISAGIHGAAAGQTGGISIPLSIFSWLAKLAADRGTSRAAARASETVRSRSPLAQSIPPVQIAPPSPLLGAVLPYQIPQGFTLPMGAVPVRAEEDKRKRK